MTSPPRLPTIRSRATGAGAAALAAALAVVVTGCGGAGPASTSSTSTSPVTASSSAGSTSTTTPTASSSSRRLTVSPRLGRPTSTERFTVGGLTAVPRHGGMRVTAQLSVARVGSAASAGRCVAVHTAALKAPQAMTSATAIPTRVTLGPGQLGGPWCTGTYSARVEQLERPVCAAGQMCPQFIRVLGIIGPVAFQIG